MALAIIALTIAPGCASWARRGYRDTASAEKMTVVRHAESVQALERELTTVKSQKIVISTQLLRSLLHNERVLQSQCKSLSGQLEAIKNIDLEETETGN